MPIKTDLLQKDKLNRTIMAKKTASVVTHLSCHEAQSISVPQLGVELGPWQWKLSIRTTSHQENPYLLWICCRFFLCGYHEAGRRTSCPHNSLHRYQFNFNHLQKLFTPFMFLMSQLTSFYIVHPLRNYCKYSFLKILLSSIFSIRVK